MPIVDPRKKEEPTDTMRIWNLASETDPTHTKEVTIGRKLTAIDSYYQIRRATEHFGPMGQGWGYEAEFSMLEFCTPPLAVVTMKLWYIDPTDERHGRVDENGNNFSRYDGSLQITCPPIRAMNKLASNDGKVDEEAFKKATTDALTKSLSYLGFSADVFMGKFDDNKYKAAIGAKFAKARQNGGKEIPESLQQIIKALPEIKEMQQLEEAFFFVFGSKAKGQAPHAHLGECSDPQREYIRLQFRKRKQELEPVENAEREDLATAG